jgi:hypothetical protein
MPIQCDRASNVIQTVGCLCFARVLSFVSLSLSSLTYRLLFARYFQTNRHGTAVILPAELSSTSFCYPRRYVFLSVSLYPEHSLKSPPLPVCIVRTRCSVRSLPFSKRNAPFIRLCVLQYVGTVLRDEFGKMESREVLERHGGEIQIVFLLLVSLHS